jgi:hypothetical protein
MAIGTRSVPDEQCQWALPVFTYNAKDPRTGEITFGSEVLGKSASARMTA